MFVVRAVRRMEEFLARGAIKIRIRIETFYSDDHSQTAKGVTFYSDDHSQTAKGANVGVPVNMSFLKLQKSYMLAHEAMGTIISIINIIVCWHTCGAQIWLQMNYCQWKCVWSIDSVSRHLLSKLSNNQY